jgi:ferrous iron transport protein B
MYTSLIDRTIFVLLRAMTTAAPAGAAIWILGNVYVYGVSLAQHIANFLNPLGVLIGLDGVIMLAYIIAIPANEIVVPTMLMVYMGAGMMTDVPTVDSLRTLLVDQYGWTLLTAINRCCFLPHNPCIQYDDLQGNQQPEVGCNERHHHPGSGFPGDLPDCQCGAPDGLGFLKTLI